MTAEANGGKIISFYSYKGGTGRSMAVANVAWLLASRGQRVLAIDWDLEAPGLHRYFEPFLTDKFLENSTGLIDFVLEFASAAVSQRKEDARPDWYLDYANILAHATPVEWDFPSPGVLHMVPAGRQDSAYAIRVNSFDWRQFYEKLGGGIWLEAVKQQMRDRYDYILIDSRTGVSDTSGVCTVQMPDELVVCFTLNQQSTRGASAVAYSALQQRRAPDGSATLRVWPLPMRVEEAEQDRLERARAVARTRFSRVLGHLPPSEQDRYWGEMEVFYYPLYAYEEVLAPFADRPRQSRSLLASMERLASHLLGVGTPWAPMPEDRRVAGLRKFTGRPALDSLEDLKLIAEEYERIRHTMDAGDERTYLMTAVLERAARLAGEDGVALVAEALFKTNTDGGRVIGLGLAAREPRRTQIDMAITAIAEMRSPFEQYHALVLAERLLLVLDPTAKEKLRGVIQSQMMRAITARDPGRWAMANRILASLGREQLGKVWKSESPVVEFPAGGTKQVCVEISPSSAFLQYSDADERHGPWVGTRQTHTVTLPKSYRLGRDLVTNADYREFMAAAGGYQREEFWPQSARNRARMLTAEGETSGPASWVRGIPPADKNRHPVTGICFYEAQAFIHWLNREAPVAGWRWTLPTEDMWEYAARTETGLIYPWGDAFEEHKCNSREAGIGDTSDVDRFASGASRQGCRDMAGNVWEFVLPAEGVDSGCVLRGGSYKNDRFEVRSYLRLFGVPPLHRPPDFGFRVAQTEDHTY
jgi:formylglycine-generating enzyme required for sulfatase activity/Mrp family chromosome partitioning ATPase